MTKRLAEYHISPEEVSRIRSLMVKYKTTCDSALQQRGNGYPAKSIDLSSPLTTFLHQRFGLEFVFFTGKKHDKPYGYAIIDHGHKTIFKEGDVMSLGQLTGLSSDQKNGQETNTGIQKIRGRERDQVDGTDPDQKQSKDMIHLLDHLIQNLEYQVEHDLRQEGSNIKGKKKRERWQRR